MIPVCCFGIANNGVEAFGLYRFRNISAGVNGEEQTLPYMMWVNEM